MMRPSRFRLTALLALASVLFLLPGCGGNGRQKVVGAVTVDAAPLESGTINFRPAPGSKANSSGAGIQNGRFEVPADKGLMPGAYQVTIQGFRKTGRMVRDPQMGQIEEIVPMQFNETGARSVTIVEGKNEFEFTLTQRKGK
ncbi:MAG: hypothetical protein NTW96_14750 [Planctomycetia bacterium]|nr:hypothetical protein [Planctomycetia bacterium]